MEPTATVQRIIDALHSSETRVEVPDCDRTDLPGVLTALGLKRGVEIGVCRAKYTILLLEAGLLVDGVDPWMAYKGYSKIKGIGRDQTTQDYNYRRAKSAVRPYGKNCHLHKDFSMTAVELYEDHSLDFVYIDGHHGFRYIAEDIVEWSKKVRPGGIVAGHDYITLIRHGVEALSGCHVQRVVDAYTISYQIKPLVILGRKEALEGEKREECRSYLWMKP